MQAAVVAAEKYQKEKLRELVATAVVATAVVHLLLLAQLTKVAVAVELALAQLQQQAVLVLLFFDMHHLKQSQLVQDLQDQLQQMVLLRSQQSLLVLEM
jgi:hypothetical protein